jgi:hypothetical protein
MRVGEHQMEAIEDVLSHEQTQQRHRKPTSPRSERSRPVFLARPSGKTLSYDQYNGAETIIPLYEAGRRSSMDHRRHSKYELQMHYHKPPKDPASYPHPFPIGRGIRKRMSGMLSTPVDIRFALTLRPTKEATYRNTKRMSKTVDLQPQLTPVAQ